MRQTSHATQSCCSKNGFVHAVEYRSLFDEIEHIDQYLFRFAKLQDTMGKKLFISILEYLQEENPKSKPFIDILNRLEQLELLEDKNNWLVLRKIRNNIAHQYEDEPKQESESSNVVYNAKPMLYL